LKTEKPIYILYFGIALGLGFLNKYSVIFYVGALLGALLLTPHRRLFRSPYFYGAVAIAFLLFLPNLIWQWSYNFPVFRHMALLRASQLVNVEPSNFILEQFLMHFPIVLIWLAGLYFLLWNKKGQAFRLLGLTCVGVILLFLISSGKPYYTLGVFPVMIAAGAYQLELATQNRYRWFRIFIWAKALAISLLVLPLGLNVLPPDTLVAYCDFLKSKVGLESPMRWEDGQIHHLPQDFADMFAWEEIAQLTAKAYHSLDKAAQANTLIYGEYYCHAGAVDHYAQKYQLPEAFCFSDSYRFWVPDAYPESINRMIYINHEVGENVRNLFSQIEKVGELSHPHARENGLGIYLMQAPRSSFASFLNERITAVKAPFKR